MAYGITRYNKQPVASVVDGTVDNTLDITLIGKNYAGYGQAFNDDLVWLLENFSNTTPPLRPISGQLWFDATTTNLKINLYEEVNNQWKTLAVNNISTSQPQFATTGDMWYDETNNQLNIFNGASYDLVGPQSVTGKGITQMQSVSLTDTALGTHGVQLAYANGTILFIVSKEEFTPNPAIAGFPTIYEGITINDQAKFNGTATNADNLGNNPPSFYAPLRNTVFPTLTTFNAGLTTGGLTVNTTKIQAVGNTITLGTNGVDVVSVDGLDLLPSTTAASNIGSDTLRFKNIYAGYMYGTSQNADYLKVGGNYRSANTSSVNNTIVARDGSGGIASTSLLTGNITSANITSSGTIFANTSVTSPNFYGNATSADQATHADTSDTANLASLSLAVEWTGILNKPQNFVYDDQNAKFYRIDITGTSAGTHNGPVFGPMTGNLYSTDSTLFFDASAKQVGFLGANLVGNLTGNSAGTHTGPVIGNVTGNVTGNLTGNVTGNVTGNLSGNVTGAVHTATDRFVGNLTGNITGNLTGNTVGTHTGPVVGNVTGNLAGNTTGFHTGNLYSIDATLFFNASTKQLGFAGANIVGSLTGPVTGNVTGNLTGNTTGTHTGPVVGNVTGNVTGNLTGSVFAQGGRILLGNGSPTSPSIAFFNDGAQDTGFYWGNDGYINIANNGGFSGQFQPNGNLAMEGQIFAGANFVGPLTGNVTGNLTGNVTGNLTGNTAGTHVGPVSGNVTGNVTGNLTGNVTGNVTGNLYGNANTATVLNNQGNVIAENNGSSEPNGLTLRSSYNNGYPTAYGNVITLGGSGGGEVLVGWSGSTGAHADNYVRSRRDTGTTWSPWAKILTDVNFGNTLARVAATGSYNDLGDKPYIPPQIANPQAQLQNIVQTIVGSIDLYTNGYYSGSSTYGGFLGGGWSTAITSNTVNTYGSTGSVVLVIDLASYFSLSNDPAALRWKGNYDLNVAPSLKSIFDGRINYYGLEPSTWAVSVTPYTFDKNSSDYGKFSIGVTISGDHWYHGTTVTAGWIGIGSRTNNVYNP
jgi:outer membrane lipoprotein SlyB